MNISEIFIKRPVATTLIMAGLVLFGIMGYFTLPVTDMPNVDFPFIVISASLRGADPETMAISVAKPLEKQLTTIAGIKNMTSTSKQGSTMVFVEFEMDRNIDDAALDVQAAISVAYRSMPDSMTDQPIYFKINPDSRPIFQLALTSDTLTTTELTEYAETYIAQRLSMVTGVAKADVRGAKRFAVRIQIDPQLMAARNIGVDEISSAVNSSNVTLPTGVLQGEDRIRNIKAAGELRTAKEFREIIVAWRDGAPVRLGDIATVIDDVEDTTTQSWLNDKLGVIIQVVRQPGGNTVQVVDNILSMLPGLIETLPPAVNLDVIEDSSQYIRDSVEEVEFTLLLTMVLVVIIIFIFLRDAMATIIPSLALPISVIFTFALMMPLDFSLDNISLLALILVVGFVVDDAIVMLENIIRHREMGKSPYVAALDGAKEVGFTIISMTISLAAVFIPLLFMPGIAGRMFYEFAAVIMIAVMISGVVSLTLTPMLSAHFLSDSSVHKSYGWGVYAALEWCFVTMHNGYDRSLHFCMRHKFLTFLTSLSLIFGTVVVASWLPTSFFPDMDGGTIAVTTKAEESISFLALSKAQKELHAIVEADPAVNTYVSIVGGNTFSGGSNTGSMTIRLKPIKERENINVIINRLREKLNQNPTLQVFVSNGSAMGGGGSQGQYTYDLVGSDTKELYATAAEVEALFKTIPELRDVSTNLQLMNPIVHLDIDRNKAAAMGITLMQIENALYSAFGTRQISVIYTPISDYKVILEVEPTMQYNASVLSTLYVRASDGRLIPLDTVVTISNQAGPLSVPHTRQFPSVTVSFNLSPGAAMGTALDNAGQQAAEILPDTVTGKFTGMAEEFQSSVTDMILLISVALLIIYIVLGVLYESFIHPITILAGLPSAVFGAMLSLWICNSELNMMAFVGIIMLIGIVKKNAIMMLDFAMEAEHKMKLSPEEAIIQGCLIRFRPIMMTTLAAIMGALPLAFGMGETGADMRQPLGICVAGGLIFSQMVTLYITPVYYVYLDRFGSFVGRVLRRIFHKEAIAIPE